MKVITSARNPLLQNALRLMIAKNCLRQQLFLVRGARLVQMAVAQHRIKMIFATATTLQRWQTLTPSLSLIAVTERLLARFHVNTPPATAVVGIAVIRPQHPEWSASALVLDGVQDPGNVGSLIRSAYQFGFDNVFLTEQTACAYHPMVVSASQGALFYVNPVMMNRSALQLQLQTHHYTVINTNLHESSSLALTKLQQLRGSLAIVLGGEGHGVDQSWTSWAHYNLHVQVIWPQLALNVAATGAIILQSAAKEREK